MERQLFRFCTVIATRLQLCSSQHLSQDIAEMDWAMHQGVARDAILLAREVMSGKGQASSGELNALQRIAAAASEPLLALGRSAGAVIFSGLGSTTAVAFTSGLGILRLGVGAPSLLLCEPWNFG